MHRSCARRRAYPSRSYNRNACQTLSARPLRPSAACCIGVLEPDRGCRFAAKLSGDWDRRAGITWSNLCMSTRLERSSTSPQCRA
jgi:hypothetical protein